MNSLADKRMNDFEDGMEYYATKVARCDVNCI